MDIQENTQYIQDLALSVVPNTPWGLGTLLLGSGRDYWVRRCVTPRLVLHVVMTGKYAP